MKPIAFLALAAAASLLCAARAPEQRTMNYRAMPGMWLDGEPAIEMELRFRGDADGETVLHLPDEWAGSQRLWEHAKLLEIQGAQRHSGFYDKPILHHRPGAKIRVRYLVVSPYKKDPGFEYEKARPLIRPDWFFFHGEGVFALPEGRSAAPARFRWRKVPKGWRVASDLDHLAGKPTSAANMIDSVAIGGTGLKVVRREVNGAPLRLAIIGKWTFEADALADTIARIVAAEDAFWGDRSSPFLVAMAPLGALPSGLSYAGTGRADAFSIASTSAFELAHATRFLAHEYMHSWVPLSLGALPDENQPVDYWFSEGFNDYLAAKVLLRSGLWTLDEFVADKNQTLLRYGTSSAKTTAAADVAELFWTDRDIQQVSYDRGHILAAVLDAEIAAGSTGAARSLDQVMRAQRKAAEGSSELATALFPRVLLAETGIDASDRIERHARLGEPLLLPEGLFGDCVRVVTTDRAAFDRGYDADATRLADGVITGVDPAGAAFAAGMRDGMRLIQREGGVIGDSTVELSYRIADEMGERVIRYMPEGKARHQVQQLMIHAATDEERARCRTRLAGEPA